MKLPQFTKGTNDSILLVSVALTGLILIGSLMATNGAGLLFLWIPGVIYVLANRISRPPVKTKEERVHETRDSAVEKWKQFCEIDRDTKAKPQMKQARIVEEAALMTCPGCGAVNRLLPQVAHGRHICGVCRTPFENFEVPRARDGARTVPKLKERFLTIMQKPRTVGWIIFGGLTLAIAIIAAVVNLNFAAPSPPASPSVEQFNPSQSLAEQLDPPTVPIKSPHPITIAAQDIPLPDNGEIQRFTSDEAAAPFQIKSTAGTNYLIKIVGAYSKSPIMTIFVHGGVETDIHVPLGNYEVHYASGVKWYGYQELFGPNTVYTKVDTIFDFRNEGTKVAGYTITLYEVIDGNLKMSQLDKSQF